MTPEEFLEDAPKLHVHPATDLPVSWGVEPGTLRRLGELVPGGGVTMETGAGASTVYFALCGFRHTAIAPDAGLLANIRAYCARHGISLERVSLVDARSEHYLPTNDLGAPDLFLIDGRHAFPSPFVDWFYAAEALKVGGHVAVDDTQILTGKILEEFLRADEHWDDGEVSGRTSVFRKLDDRVHEDGWGQQAFLTSRRELTPGSMVAVAVPKAWIACDRGELERALEITDRLAESHGEDAEALTVRGSALRRLRRIEEADACLARAIELAPGAHAAYAERAWLNLLRNDAEAAIRDATRARELVDPRDLAAAAVHDVLGSALGHAGRLDEALVELDLAVSRRPNHAWFHVHRGQCLAALRRFSEAAEAAARALALDPDNQEARALREPGSGPA